MCGFDQVWSSLTDDEKAILSVVIVAIKMRPFIISNIEAIRS